MKRDNNFLTPIHWILFVIILAPIYWLKYGENFFNFIFAYFLFVSIYGYFYYKKLALKNNTAIFQEFKRDIPTFGLPDMNIISIIMMLLLLSPFWIWIFL